MIVNIIFNTVNNILNESFLSNEIIPVLKKIKKLNVLLFNLGKFSRRRGIHDKDLRELIRPCDKDQSGGL